MTKLFNFCVLTSLMISPVWAEPALKETKPLESAEYTAQINKLLTADDRAALILGEKITAIRYALDNPEMPGNLEMITALGNDQRYYMLVRGWLGYQLQADLSILQARQGKAAEKIQQRVELVQKAIRRIDLE